MFARGWRPLAKLEYRPWPPLLPSSLAQPPQPGATRWSKKTAFGVFPGRTATAKKVSRSQSFLSTATPLVRAAGFEVGHTFHGQFSR
nr:MAG TPA: hypothetical protein [Caudoviricetes sp.]